MGEGLSHERHRAFRGRDMASRTHPEPLASTAKASPARRARDHIELRLGRNAIATPKKTTETTNSSGFLIRRNVTR